MTNARDRVEGTTRESETELWISRLRESDPRSVSETVIEALASAMDADPSEIGTVLYDRIDPDALDAIFGSRADGTPRPGGRVSFPLEDYVVSVRKESEYVVEVRPSDRAAGV